MNKPINTPTGINEMIKRRCNEIHISIFHKLRCTILGPADINKLLYSCSQRTSRKMFPLVFRIVLTVWKNASNMVVGLNGNHILYHTCSLSITIGYGLDSGRVGLRFPAGASR
jgi:hypothetical protein